jgi:hypothetical protein
MIQRAVDYVFLSATAAALQVVVLLLKQMRQSQVGNAKRQKTEVPFSA